MQPLAGAVLTGGQSRRMGRDKALVAVDGSPMAQRVATAMIQAGCDPVVLVGGDATGLGSLGLRVLEDRWPGEGPLGAIITVLEHTRVPTVVAACDLPWLDATTVRTLTSFDGVSGDSVVEPVDVWPVDVLAVDVVLATTDRDELMCACWMPSALPELHRQFAAGQRAIRAALVALRVARRPVAATALRNVNTPQDVPPL